MMLIAPIGMIFVPSREGIRHSPREITSAEDMVNGASVLGKSILAIDRAELRDRTRPQRAGEVRPMKI